MRLPKTRIAKVPRLREKYLAQLRHWLVQNFPERQIYIRSDGRVQFISFSANLQAALAALSLLFLGWVAFATVNVMFKDSMIVERDQRYSRTQSVYESRIADMESSNAELGHALAVIEDRFESTVGEVRKMQGTLQDFLDRKRQADSILQNLGAAGSKVSTGSMAAGSSLAYSYGIGARDSGRNSSAYSAAAGAASPAAHRLAFGFDAIHRRLSGIVDAIFGGAPSVRPQDSQTLSADMYRRHPQLRVLERQVERIRHIGDNDAALVNLAQAQVMTGTAELRDVIGRTGINPDAFVERTAGAEGGPDIPLDDVHIQGIADSQFVAAYLRAAASLGQLDEFLSAIHHIPLAVPVSGPQFERTSGFGPRRDPFTGHLAFHPGLDFAGPIGSLVRATAPGRVVFAGPRGGYGNMVEVDHGFGIHTRYAHLEQTLVKVGDRVAIGSPVGKLGSTGRSTGPHVHYEVWFDNVVRDPKNFVDAIQNQRAGSSAEQIGRY